MRAKDRRAAWLPEIRDAYCGEQERDDCLDDGKDCDLLAAKNRIQPHAGGKQSKDRDAGSEQFNAAQRRVSFARIESP